MVPKRIWWLLPKVLWPSTEILRDSIRMERPEKILSTFRLHSCCPTVPVKIYFHIFSKYENILHGMLFGNCPPKLLGWETMIYEYFYYFKIYFIFSLFTHEENLKSLSLLHYNFFFSTSYVLGMLLGTEDAAVNKIIPLFTWRSYSSGGTCAVYKYRNISSSFK